MDDQYGNGNPPYSLYQAEDGLWGLMDKDGVKLPAVFKRSDDIFSCVPWEVLNFNPEEGFDLLAWYDPFEVWFNFTFEDDRYPEEYAKYLWKCPDKGFSEYEAEFHHVLPGLCWLFDCINEAKRIMSIDDEDEYQSAMLHFMDQYPQLDHLADYNGDLDPIMRSENVSEDMKIALWGAKVGLDYHVRTFLEDISEWQSN